MCHPVVVKRGYAIAKGQTVKNKKRFSERVLPRPLKRLSRAFKKVVRSPKDIFKKDSDIFIRFLSLIDFSVVSESLLKNTYNL